MSNTMQINIDEGTLWLLMQALRRNGRPNASVDDAVQEIKRIIEENDQLNREDRG